MYKFLLSILVCFTLLGCGGKELESLKAENLAQKNEIQSLKFEISKLHQTAEFNFRQGQDYVESQDWDAAIQSFNTVIKKYPDSPLVASATEALSSAESSRERNLREFAEKQRLVEEEKEKEMKEVGEPIDYGEFYAKSKTGMTYGKRYRFYACLSQTGCIIHQDMSINQKVCGVEPQFDSQDEYEAFLTTGQKFCGTIVASMMRGQYGGTVVVNRLH